MDQVIFTGLEINTQNASDFDELQMRKISTSKRLQVKSSMSPKHLERICLLNGLTSLLVEKFSLAKLCEWTEKLTLRSVFTHSKLFQLIVSISLLIIELFDFRVEM